MTDIEATIRPRRSVLWDVVKFVFPAFDSQSTIIAFGRSIFTPPHFQIGQDLVVHELVHIKQQHSSYLYAIYWWARYIFSMQFRYIQELEAYSEQLKYLYKVTADRNRRSIYRLKIASILSGPLYNHMIPYTIALRDLPK